MDKKEERRPVPGEGNMIYPEDKNVPIQGEIKDPKVGLQEPTQDQNPQDDGDAEYGD